MAIRAVSEFKFEDDPTIVKASRIILSHGSQPHRVVLRKLDNSRGEEYVTHQENLVLDGTTWKHGDFYWGHYFLDSYEAAQRDYLDRVAKL